MASKKQRYGIVFLHNQTIDKALLQSSIKECIHSLLTFVQVDLVFPFALLIFLKVGLYCFDTALNLSKSHIVNQFSHFGIALFECSKSVDKLKAVELLRGLGES